MNGAAPKAGYAAIAPSYDAGRHMLESAERLWTELIRDRGRIEPGSLCLDLGCGTGRFAVPLARVTGARFVGADLSAEMLAQAATKPGDVRWVRCDAHRLAFLPGVFQCVFMSLVLHHVQDMDRVLKGCFRALRPGGVCLVRTSGHDDLATMPVYRFFPRALEIDRNRLPEVSVIEDSMLRAGFGSARHEKVVQEIVTSADAYLHKTRRRNISTLTFMSGEEMSEGLRRMDEHFASIGEEAALAEIATEQLTLIIGER